MKSVFDYSAEPYDGPNLPYALWEEYSDPEAIGQKRGTIFPNGALEVRPERFRVAGFDELMDGLSRIAQQHT